MEFSIGTKRLIKRKLWPNWTLNNPQPNVLLDFHGNFCAENEVLKPRRALNREGFTCSCGDGDVLSCSTSVIFRDKGSNRVCVLCVAVVK